MTFLILILAMILPLIILLVWLLLAPVRASCLHCDDSRRCGCGGGSSCCQCLDRGSYETSPRGRK